MAFLLPVLVAVVLSWPLVLHLGTALPGYPNQDALDTVFLRGAVAGLLEGPGVRSVAAWWPVGFEPLQLTPNVLDHLVALPLVRLLPFPLADNLWWLLVLSANGWAGQRLGRRIGGSRAAGLLTGVAWAAAEPLLREANLHHGPQAFTPFVPLFLDALLEVLDGEGRPRRGAALRSGLWFSLSALTYWYNGLFLLLGSVLLALGRPRRLHHLGPGVLLAAVLLVPPLLPWLGNWDGQGLTSGFVAPVVSHDAPALAAVPAPAQMSVLHGSDLLFPFRARPLDRSNRLSLVLLLAAVLGARRAPPWQRRGLAAMAVVGGVLLLGPVLKAGEAPVMAGGRFLTLPFAWLGQLHPALGRLHWPERWGLLIPLALLPLAARTPRPGLLAALLLAEVLALSGNAPLAMQDLRLLEGWRTLSGAPGAVLEVPLRRWGLDAGYAGLHGRYHGRPMVNPMLLPPGVVPPAGWEAWRDAQPFIRYLDGVEAGNTPAPPGEEAVAALRSAGVAAVALDAEPGGVTTPGRMRRYRTRLSAVLGPPVDLGVAVVWWLDPAVPPPAAVDGDAWRAEATRWRQAHPVAAPDTLLKPFTAFVPGTR